MPVLLPSARPARPARPPPAEPAAVCTAPHRTHRTGNKNRTGPPIAPPRTDELLLLLLPISAGRPVSRHRRARAGTAAGPRPRARRARMNKSVGRRRRRRRRRLAQRSPCRGVAASRRRGVAASRCRGVRCRRYVPAGGCGELAASEGRRVGEGRRPLPVGT